MGGGKPIMWVRFPEFYLTDYFYMNRNYWDAVTFVPRRTVIFYGFGLFSNYNGKDLKLRVGYALNEEGIQAEVDADYADADKDSEKKWHEIDFR